MALIGSNQQSSNTSINFFTFTNPIKLDRANYMIWKQQVLSSIRGNGLEGYIDISRICPSQFLSPGAKSEGSSSFSIEGQENPEYAAWRRQDQLLLSWILSSMNVDILSLVVSSKTSFELWKNLKKQFGSESMAKKVHLKMLLSNLRKGSLTMSEYFTKLQSVTDGLALASSPVNDLDLITHLITGLDQSYYPVVVYIEANMLKMDLSEAYAMLLAHEARLENNKLHDSKETKNNYAANVAQVGNFSKKGNNNNQNNWKAGGNNWNNNSSGRGGYQGGAGKNFAQRTGIACQICFRFNHTAADCRDRFNKNFTPNFPTPAPNHFSNQHQGPRAAFITTSEGVADQGWFLDSGATHHLTNTVQNLSDGKIYFGSNLLTVGNGQGLRITHIGYTQLHTSFGTCLQLQNVLCVPQITKNLISISKLLTDNDITIEFFSDVCFLKDKVKGTLLAQGIAKDGLYKLLSKEESISPSSSFLQVSHLSSMMSILSWNNVVNYVQHSNNDFCFESTSPVSFQASSSMSANVLHNRLGHPKLFSSSESSSNSLSSYSPSICILNNSGLHQSSALSPASEVLPTSHSPQQPQQNAYSHCHSPISDSSISSSPHNPLSNTSVELQSSPHHVILTHQMVTRAKSGIFKPKTYLTATQYLAPLNTKAALVDTKWKLAMQDEYNTWQQNGTWTLVPADTATKPVGNKWVFLVKYNPDGNISKYKARLVAKGFHQTYGVDFFETFSPVVKPCTVHIVLSLAVMHCWPIRQLDVNNAFLNGMLTEDVFMPQPEGFINSQFPNHICRLHKALYGLKQAPRAWYDKLKGSLVQWGFRSSKSDTSLFFKHTGSDVLIILVYVDDILITGSSNVYITEVISQLSSEFAVKDLGDFNYFFGVEVTPSAEGLHLSQTKYVGDILRKAHMLGSKGCNTPISVGEKLQKDKGCTFENSSLYRSIIGSLQYLTLTRPDIAFTVNILSQFLAVPTTLHWQACKRVLRYLQSTTHFGLQFFKSGSPSLTADSDADWGSDLDDRRSVGGYCVYLGSNLVSWSSKKQNIVSRSSAESEYRALALATSEVLWITYLLKELKVSLQKPLVLLYDNSSAEALASNLKGMLRIKYAESSAESSSHAGSKKIDPRISAAEVELVLEAYHRVRQTRIIHIDDSRKEKQQKWIPPPKDVFKINVDVTTSSKDQKVGLATVITNSNGKLVAEAEAIEWGFQVAKEAALSSLIIESDCQEVVELINNTNGSRTTVHWIISEIQHQKRDFPTV
ncbi:retrovirus-related pol polyprotein from transposon RE1 [Citrus sinensis]|nr:retrovirus-related pol polyprotein from transposon RE1 [Citrus sinensis]